MGSSLRRRSELGFEERHHNTFKEHRNEKGSCHTSYDLFDGIFLL